MDGFETKVKTFEHKQVVLDLMIKVVNELLNRASTHDRSKLDDAENDLFAKYTPELNKATYGSEQYNDLLLSLKPALDRHYAINAHHPEHYKNGVEGMNLIDIVEMFVDWKASSLRQNDGNINKSIEYNSSRFKIGKQLTKIFENSTHLFSDYTVRL